MEAVASHRAVPRSYYPAEERDRQERADLEELVHRYIPVLERVRVERDKALAERDDARRERDEALEELRRYREKAGSEG